MALEPTEEDMRQKEQITSRTKFEDFRRCSTKRRASYRCLVEEMDYIWTKAAHKQQCPTRARNMKWPGWVCRQSIDHKHLGGRVPTVASLELVKGSLVWTRNLVMMIPCLKLRQHILVELGFIRVTHLLNSRWNMEVDQDLE